MKKTLSLVLIMAMLLSLLPTLIQPAHAAVDDIGTMNALDALGIDTSAMPEGYDPDSTDNPYGREIVTINPVYELYSSQVETHPDTGVHYQVQSLYGHDEPLGQPMWWFYSSSNLPVNPDIPFEPLVVTASAAGNFVGEGEDGWAVAKTPHVVTVGAGDWSSGGGLYLYLSGALDQATGSLKTLIAPAANPGGDDPVIGNSADPSYETSPIFLQNYLRIATGDFTNDGIDEVAVYVPERGRPRVEIYQLALTSHDSDDAYLDPAKWHMVWSYYLDCDHVPNMVSLTAGDLNRNGTDDLAVTWGYYRGPHDNSGASRAVVLYGSNTHMFHEKRDIELLYEGEPIVRAAFAHGDIQGDNMPELILGGQLHADIAGGNLFSRFVAVYVYDGHRDRFVQATARNFDLFEKDEEGEFVHPAMGVDRSLGELDGTYHFHSSLASHANISAVNLEGVGHAAHIYLDSLLIEHGPEGLTIHAALDRHPDVNYHGHARYFYAEFDVFGGDYTGDTRETLHLMHYYHFATDPYGLLTEVAGPLHALGIGYLWWYGKPEYPQGIEVWRQEAVPFSYSFCRLNTDNDTAFLRYTGRHSVHYSDPKVLAVLASPPYFADLDNDELSGNYMGSETSYRSSTGEGDNRVVSHALLVGAYVKFQREISLFGLTAASMEMGLSYQANLTWATREAEHLEQSISYSTPAGQDSVAFYSIPVEEYVYQSVTPIFDEETGEITGWVDQLMSVNIPHPAAVKVLPLATYERIAADFRELPRIARDVLTHTVGIPSTYPRSAAGFKDPYVYSGDWAGVGYGLGSTQQEIAYTKTDETSFSHTHKVEAFLGAGAGGLIIGITLGYQGGVASATIDTEGSTYSGKINNMPIEAEPHNYNYAWKLLAYEHSGGDMAFPVVTYLVDGVSAPPRLPTDFHQNTQKTTPNSITMTWSYRGLASGFQVYRYYDFPDGSGSYELAFVPAGDRLRTDGDTIFYEYTDAGLNPYTEYHYQIQVVGPGQPTDSILSKVYGFRTRAEEGYPDLHLAGVGVDGTLQIWPDHASVVAVDVSNIDDYGQHPRYQWQKLSARDGWQDIGGATRAHYTFQGSGMDDEGQYRCRINVVYGSFYISAYTEAFTAVYAMRTPEVRSFTVRDAAGETNVPTIILDLGSSHHNHFTRPYGNVVFHIRGADYRDGIVVALQPTSVDGVNRAALTLDLDRPLPDGAYEISAYYQGSRVYQALTVDPIPYLAGTGEGYILTVDSEHVYGDSMDPTVLRLTKVGGNTTASGITDPVRYEVWGRPQFVDGDTVTAYWVGEFELEAWIGDDLVGVRPFRVWPREITVGIDDQVREAYRPDLEHPDHAYLWVDGFTPLAYDDAIGGNLNIEVVAFNTAGTRTVIGPDTHPGMYDIMGARAYAVPSGLCKLQNYDITFLRGRYILTGPVFGVHAIAAPFHGQIVGTIELVAPERNTEWPRDYGQGTYLTFAATPHAGYDVRRWRVQNASGDVIVTVDGPTTVLHYKMPAEAIDVIVDFTVAQRRLEFRALGEHDWDGGEVRCVSNPSLASGDVAMEGAEFLFEALPAGGYHLEHWLLTEVGKTPTYPEIIHDPDHPYPMCRIVMGSGDTVLYALFARQSYELALEGDLQAQYWADVEGVPVWTTALSGAQIAGDTEVTVIARPGFSVVSDAAWTHNGSPVSADFNSDNQRYTFPIMGDTVIAVETEVGHFYIDLQIEGPGDGDNAVSVTVNGVPVDPWDLQGIPGDASLVFAASPARGYVFEGWVLNGGDLIEGSTLHLAGLGDDLEVRAVFRAHDTYPVTVTHTDRGRVTYTLNEDDPVIIASGDDIDAFEGDTVILTAVPEPDFMVGSWRINGVLEDTRERIRVFEDIGKALTVDVSFVPQTYTLVTYWAGEHGTVSATTDGVSFESTSERIIGNGTRLEFTAAPDPGYMVGHWVHNGQVITTVDTIYVIPALSGPTHVEVYFVDETTKRRVEIIDHNTTTTAAYGEMFDPDTVYHGSEAVFTVTPDEGFRVASVSVTGHHGPGDLGGFDSIEKLPDGSWICVVEAVTADLVVTAEAVRFYHISLLGAPGGSIMASTDWAVEGEEIILTATPSSNYTFQYWTVLVDGVEEIYSWVTPATLVMPARDIGVTATFESTVTDVITPPPSPQPPPPSQPVAGYDLTVEAEGGGATNPAPGVHKYSAGAKVTIEAMPAGGWVFGGWHMDGQPTGVTAETINITVDSDTTITAVFFEAPAALPVVSVLVDPVHGGIVEIPELVEIVVPPGSTDGPVRFEVSVRSADDPEIRGVVGLRVSVGGLVYEITATDEDGQRIRELHHALILTFFYPPGEVDDPDDLLIHVYDEDLGIWVPLPTDADPVTGSVTTTIDHLSLFATFETSGRLTDIARHWAEADILKLTAVGAISGYPDRTFRPGDLVTREQFARMLVDAAGLPVDPVPRRIGLMFDDVEGISVWARVYVEAATAGGLIMGFDDDTFRPLDHVSRAQVAVMLSRALGLTPVGTPSYADASEIPGWAAGHVAVLSALDIVRGLPGNLFVPHRATTRAEAAAFLSRYLRQ